MYMSEVSSSEVSVEEEGGSSGSSVEMEMFGEKYRREKRLGAGTFGVVYRVVNCTTNEAAAMKLEPTLGSHSTLDRESKILRSLSVISGVPRFINYGTVGKNRVLLMQLLGPSLHRLLHYCGGTFTVKTVCMLALQLLSRIERVHNRNVIHRDLKPDNIVMGLGENEQFAYVVDFGVSKFYRHPKTLEHIPHRINKDFVGTPRFVSINCHQGNEASRRDDLESLAYMLISFLKGRLPWQGLRVTNGSKEDQRERIKMCKMITSVSELCEGLPSIFSKLLLYSRRLNFNETPDYSYLKQLFTRFMEKHNVIYDYVFDWTVVYMKQRSQIPFNFRQEILQEPLLQVDQNNNNRNCGNKHSSHNQSSQLQGRLGKIMEPQSAPHQVLVVDPGVFPAFADHTNQGFVQQISHPFFVNGCSFQYSDEMEMAEGQVNHNHQVDIERPQYINGNPQHFNYNFNVPCAPDMFCSSIGDAHANNFAGYSYAWCGDSFLLC